jgi:hypothetical protein
MPEAVNLVRAFFWLGIVAALASGHPFSALGQERTLSQVAAERPFSEYGEWWEIRRAC